LGLGCACRGVVIAREYQLPIVKLGPPFEGPAVL
jgi:hypothetical protein